MSDQEVDVFGIFLTGITSLSGLCVISSEANALIRTPPGFSSFSENTKVAIHRAFGRIRIIPGELLKALTKESVLQMFSLVIRSDI